MPIKAFSNKDKKRPNYLYTHECVCSVVSNYLWPYGFSPPGSSVYGISQARILEWVAIFFSSRSSQPKDQTCVSYTSGRFFTSEPPRMPLKESEVAQLCPTFCDPMDCCLPGSSVHGIFQTRILEWGAIAFSRRSSRPRDRTGLSRIVGRGFTVWATWEVPRYKYRSVYNYVYFCCNCNCLFSFNELHLEWLEFSIMLSLKICKLDQIQIFFS